nr:ALPV-330 [Albatrosspox virus]
MLESGTLADDYYFILLKMNKTLISNISIIRKIILVIVGS